MKRFISLLLALVLCTGVLAGICFAKDYAKPDECAPEAANIVVTHAGDATAKYYFSELSGDLINWATQKLSGDTIIALTKDYTVEKTNGQVRFYIQHTKGEWYNSAPDAKDLIFDLGGHTLSYTGDQNLFRITRYGITVKNGTIEYDSIRSVFSIGNSTEQTATSNGTTLYEPELNLEDVEIYHNGTGASSSIVTSNMHGTIVNVKDSVLWTAKKPVMEISKTDQSNISWYKPYTGAAKVSVNIENSTVGSGGNYPVTLTDKFELGTDTFALNVKNSTLVTNVKSGKIIADAAAETLNSNGQEATVEENWSKMVSHGTLEGTAYVYGDTSVKLPFTDVAENAWYYTFVRDLYSAKIIAGMTETTFVPEGTLTYGQALKLVTLAVGAPEQAAIDAHWASGYLNYAMGQGWLYEEVNLDSKISRLQFCQIAAAAAGIMEQPESNPFKDTADGAVLALYKAGIINGMTADTFSPDSSLTRAQISKIICGIIAK